LRVCCCGWCLKSPTITVSYGKSLWDVTLARWLKSLDSLSTTELRVSEMFLVHDRRLYTTRYPGLYAFSRFLGHAEFREATAFAGPRELQGLKVDMRRVIGQNYRILGPLPYRGDEVEVSIGLLSLQGEDLAERMLNVLSRLASITGAGQLSIPAAVAQPIKGAVDDLLGLSQTELCIGIHDRFALQSQSPNSRLAPGHLLVANTPDGTLKPSEAWIREGQLFVGPSLEQARPPKDFDYFLLSLERLDQRQDWSSLELVAPRIKNLSELLAKSTSENDLRTEFTLFKGAVLSSPDLIHKDCARIILGMKERIKETLELRRSGLDDVKFLSDGTEAGVRPSPLGDLNSIGDEVPVEISQRATNRDLLEVDIR
jgi:hypothetical protein